MHVGIIPTAQISRDLHHRFWQLFAIEYAGHTEHRDKGAFTNIFRRGLGVVKGKIGASKFWEKKVESSGRKVTVARKQKRHCRLVS